MDLKPITRSSIQAPYQEFPLVIKPNNSLKVDYATDNLVVLNISNPSALYVRFGGSANQTHLTQGMQYQLNEVTEYVTIFNKSDEDLIVTIALGIGTIVDNRLSVQGTIFIDNTNDTPITVVSRKSSVTTERKTFTVTGQMQIDATNSQKIVIQNVGSAVMHLFAANGFELQSGGVFEDSIAGVFDVYGTNGSSFVVGSFA